MFRIGGFGIQRCPKCGTEVNVRDPSAPVAAAPSFATGLPSALDAAYAPPSTELDTPPTVAGTEDAELLPWDRRDELGLWPALVQTVRMVLLEPATAFARVHPEKRGMFPFLVLTFLVPMVLSSVVRAYLPMSEGRLAERELASAAYAKQGMPPALAEVFLDMSYPRPETLATSLAYALPFMLLVLLLGTAWLHGLLALFGRARPGVYRTWKAICLAYVPTFFGVVPYLGQAVAGFWSVGLLVYGLARAHGTRKRWIVFVLFGVPMVLAVVAALAAGVLVGMGRRG